MNLLKLQLLTFLMSSTWAFSQVIVNEYSCSNVSTLTDNYGENEDWIELLKKGFENKNFELLHILDIAY